MVGDTLAGPIKFSTLVEESTIITHIYHVVLLCFGFSDLGRFGYDRYDLLDIDLGMN